MNRQAGGTGVMGGRYVVVDIHPDNAFQGNFKGNTPGMLNIKGRYKTADDAKKDSQDVMFGLKNVFVSTCVYDTQTEQFFSNNDPARLTKENVRRCLNGEVVIANK